MQETLYIFGFWAHRYPVECIAINDGLVATGAHKELKVWDWDTDCKSSSSRSLITAHGSFVHSAHHHDLLREFPEPPKSSNNLHEEVLLVSLHWTQRRRVLMATYMYHGI